MALFIAFNNGPIPPGPTTCLHKSNLPSRVIVPLIRWGYGYEDKTTPEYKDKVVKKFLEDTKEKKVIPNSNGENWF